MSKETQMNQNEIVKGMAGSATGLIAMATGWLADIEPALRVVSLAAGLVLTCVMIRYWWKKTAAIKKGRH